MWIGIISAIISGIAYPFSLFFTGKLANILLMYGKVCSVAIAHFIIVYDLIQSPKNEQLWEEGYRIVLIDACAGLLLICVTLAHNVCLKIACRNVVFTLRSRFVESMLRQDAGFFDEHNLGTLNSQLNE